MKKKQKPLAQIAYEADSKHTHNAEFWGPWEKAQPWIRGVYQIEARAVAREVKRRLRTKTKRSE